MDYVVGSVAALISGNVTPNRPRILKRALTPTKHQPSPNVTPKSEFVDDRSIFLSPTLQKKKAIVKKSPKRIFQNPDMDITNDGDGTSVKAEKVKKHLKEELDCDKLVMDNPGKQNYVTGVQNESFECKSPKKKIKNLQEGESVLGNAQMTNENTPKKKKKQNHSMPNLSEAVKDQEITSVATDDKIKVEPVVTPTKIKKQKNLMSHENKDNLSLKADANESNSLQITPKKKKKKNNSFINASDTALSTQIDMESNIKTKQANGIKNTKKEKNFVSITIDHKNNNSSNFQTDVNISNSVQNTPKKNKRKRNAKSNSSEIVEENQELNSMDTDIKTKAESEATLKTKKKQKNSVDTMEHENKENVNLKTDKFITDTVQSTLKKKKNRKKNKKAKTSLQTAHVTQNIEKSPDEQDGPQIIKRKRKLSDVANKELNKIKIVEEKLTISDSKSKKKNKRMKKSKQTQNTVTDPDLDIENQEPTDNIQRKKKKPHKHIINPNAITNKDTDSEHESDNEINSENEEANKKILNDRASEESSDDDEEEEESKTKIVKKNEGAKKTERTEINMEEELKRTVFVGNVVYTPKCKKELKQIFMHYGPIETIRLRNIPIKDARLTPKLAVIKNELHPERSTINVYIKFKHADSADKALAENNTLYKDKHLRVTRSESTGNIHDPKASVFVGNLPFALEDEGLREKFEKCGEIESVRIVRDKKTNIGKGFGYVNFTSKDSVELALALTEEDLTIKNRILRVKRCTHTNKPYDNTSYNQSLNQRDFDNRGRGFNSRGRGGLSRGGQRGFNDRGQGFNDRGGQAFNDRRGQGFNEKRGQGFNDRGGRGFNDRGGKGFNDRGGQAFNDRRGQGFNDRGGQRGFRQGRGGQNFSSRGGQTSFNSRGQDGQSQGFQQGRSDKNDIGAFRRIMNKRQHQEGGNDGPPQKRPKNINQPGNEKKPRKEFVGMTAEKKTKRKNSKSQGLRQKKALSEILSK